MLVYGATEGHKHTQWKTHGMFHVCTESFGNIECISVNIILYVCCVATLLGQSEIDVKRVTKEN